MARLAGRTRAITTYFVYRASATLLRVMPGPISRATARVAALISWAIDPVRRRVVAENLRPILGSDASERLLGQTVRRAFVEYGLYWSLASRVRTSDTARHPDRFVLEGEETLRKLAAEGNGVILALPHVGCWEAGAAWSSSIGYPLTTVAEVLEPPELFAWFVEMRRRVDLQVLPVGVTTISQLLAVLSRGGVIALLSDRDVVGDGVPVTFFDQPTRIPGGPALLAIRSGAPLVPCAVYSQAKGRFLLRVADPVDTARSGHLRDDVVKVTQALAWSFEPLIKQAPAQWHVFQPMWENISVAGRATPVEQGPRIERR